MGAALYALPDVAWRSLLGGALTVRRIEGLPLLGRCTEAEVRAALLSSGLVSGSVL